MTASRRLLCFALGALLASPAGAFTWEADHLVVSVGGTAVLTDDFGDGVAPPVAPGGAAPYATQGTWGPEASGIVFADESGALDQGTGLVHTAVRQSFVSFTQDVSVASTWNLVAHDVGRSGGYGSIFISNVAGAISALILVAVLDPTSGELTLNYSSFNETTMVTTPIDSLSLGVVAADQIILTLSQAAGSFSVSGSYELLQAGSSVGGGTLATAATLDPAAIGLAFGLQAATVVPEPGTLGLLGLGMAGLVVASRRRS